eukprot:SAG22_NODE_21265_length_258_cov_0.981132_1_plen_33_part_10
MRDTLISDDARTGPPTTGVPGLPDRGDLGWHHR